MNFLCRTGLTLALLCSTAFAADPVQITTEEQKLSYAVGVLFGRNMSLEVDVDNDAFLQGVRDVLEGQQLKLAPEEMRDVVQRFQDQQVVGMKGIQLIALHIQYPQHVPFEF